MCANNYEPVIAKWKSDLITARAKRMGFDGHELLEAQQELVLHVARFRHEPARSNGASENTALTSVIDRCLKALRRAGSRYKKHLGRACNQRANRIMSCTDPYSMDSHLLALDVRQAMSRLTPRAQKVCALLGQGESVDQIAQTLGCGWHTVRRIIEEVRAQFQAVGLDGWIIAS